MKEQTPNAATAFAKMLYNPPVLYVADFVLRPLQMSDAEAFYEHARNPNVVRFTTWEAYKEPSQATEFIERQLELQKQGKCTPWAICLHKEDLVIGTCGFVSYSERDRSAEIGFALREEYWGKGIVRQAAARIMEHAFISVDLHRIEAQVCSENERSLRLLSKLGFTKEGCRREAYRKGEQLHDLVILGILQQEWKQKPALGALAADHE